MRTKKGNAEANLTSTNGSLAKVLVHFKKEKPLTTVI